MSFVTGSDRQSLKFKMVQLEALVLQRRPLSVIVPPTQDQFTQAIGQLLVSSPV